MTDEHEIVAVIDSIGESFSRLDIPAWLDNFHQPRLMVLPDRCLSPASEAECREAMGPYFQELADCGFNRTVLDRSAVRFLSKTTAVASTVWTRYADDEVLERLGATYLFQKANGRWAATTITTHSADVMLVE